MAWMVYEAWRKRHEAGCFIPQDIQVLMREIDRMRAELVKINEIANIPPWDDSYFGSMNARMEKIWLLSRGYRD